MDDERSKGGSRILRHDPIEGTDGVAHADDDAIVAHLRRHLEGESFVWHELISDRVHVDVHVIKATAARPFNVLVTSGMSARPMTMPPGMEEPENWRRAELSLLLPADWPMSREALREESHYWPIRLLKSLARLPHEYGTWLGYGHTVPNGDPPESYAPGTSFCCAIVLGPFVLGGEFARLDTADGRINFYSVVPLTLREMNFKLEAGTDALLDRLDSIEFEAYGPISPARQSTV